MFLPFWKLAMKVHVVAISLNGGWHKKPCNFVIFG
jgi:hypothetical protein